MKRVSRAKGVVSVDTAAIEALAERFYAQPLVARPDGEKMFPEMCCTKFNAEAVLRLLLDPAPSFYGHKEAAFAALLSWTIAPEDDGIRLEFIALAVKRLLAKAEDQAFALDLSSPLHADLAARYLIAGPQFIEQIYAAISGMALLAEHGSPAITEIVFEVDRVPIGTLNKMMTYSHYLADDQARGQPSVNRAIEMVGRIGEHGISSRSAIYGQWAKSKDNIALLYSAASIKIGGNTLLDSLISGQINLSKYQRYLQTWIARARYVCEHILRRMPDEQLYLNNVKPLMLVDPHAFPHRDFSTKELQALAS
ncbi:hypothetical protein ASG19_04345 [Rhizobium sp. Leaf306]|uniref:hypothetical protein n=1 Tax=Rhizobium sp. Leaf306 TaxID=1736330 RepID=UPI0007151487|nr:hypothetical protein [Rhizobium sp. Leaf306]KQQ38292.1 hypothetical protein ASG19_04345 [Rhizobium sp. Leaf306]